MDNLLVILAGILVLAMIQSGVQSLYWIGLSTFLLGIAYITYDVIK